MGTDVKATRGLDYLAWNESEVLLERGLIFEVKEALGEGNAGLQTYVLEVVGRE
jgi:hypothetical protein